MKSVYLFVLGVAVVTVALSCRHAEKEAVIWEGEISEKSTVIDTSFLKNLNLVYLETDSSSLIKRIGRIFLDKKKIFVFDEALSKLVLFNAEGKYIRHLQRIGRGPQEYRSLIDVYVSAEDKKIYVLTDYPYRIMTFDYQMNYLSQMHLDELYLEFVEKEDYFIGRRPALKNGDPEAFNFDIIDKETGEVMKSYLPIQADVNQLSRAQIPGKMLTKTSSVLLTTLEEEAIYELSDKGYNKKYSFKLKSEGEAPKEYPKQIVDVIESKKFLLFNTEEGMYLYNRQNNQLNRFKYGIENQEVLNSSISRYIPIGNNSEKVAFVVNPLTIKVFEKAINKRVEELKDSSLLDSKLMEFASQIKIDDNPILFIYEFKD